MLNIVGNSSVSLYGVKKKYTNDKQHDTNNVSNVVEGMIDIEMSSALQSLH